MPPSSLQRLSLWMPLFLKCSPVFASMTGLFSEFFFSDLDLSIHPFPKCILIKDLFLECFSFLYIFSHLAISSDVMAQWIALCDWQPKMYLLLSPKFMCAVFFFFLAALGLRCCASLVAASGGYSPLWCAGFSLRRLLLLQSTDSRCVGFSSCGMWAASCVSQALEHRLSSRA